MEQWWPVQHDAPVNRDGRNFTGANYVRLPAAE